MSIFLVHLIFESCQMPFGKVQHLHEYFSIIPSKNLNNSFSQIWFIFHKALLTRFYYVYHFYLITYFHVDYVNFSSMPPFLEHIKHLSVGLSGDLKWKSSCILSKNCKPWIKIESPDLEFLGHRCMWYRKASLPSLSTGQKKDLVYWRGGEK